MRKNVFGLALSMLLVLCAVAVSAQETTVEPPLPTVEVTLDLTPISTVTPAATGEVTTEPTMETTASATAETTAMPTSEATGEISVTAEATVVPGDNNAYLRIANFAADSGSLSATLNNITVNNLTFPGVSEWIPVTPGSYTVNVTGGGSFAPLSVDAAADTWQTIAIVGSGDSLQGSVVAEDYRELLPGTGTFTFVNALEGSAPVNVMRNDVAYFAQIGFPGTDSTSSSSLRGDPGVFDVKAVDPNDPSIVIAETPGLELRENTYTLVALIGPADAPRLFTFVTDESAVEIARGLLPKPGTLMDALRANSNLTAFADALQAAGLSDLLTGETEYTIFAPANFAIDGSDTLTAEDQANLLRSYIVEGKYTKNEVLNAGTLTALDGTTLTITTDQSGIYVNGILVIDVNISATNGVIHMIRARLDSDQASQ